MGSLSGDLAVNGEEEGGSRLGNHAIVGAKSLISSASRNRAPRHARLARSIPPGIDSALRARRIMILTDFIVRAVAYSHTCFEEVR